MVLGGFLKILRGRPLVKKLLGSPKSKWKENIIMHFKEIAINARNWIDSAQDRDYWRALVNAGLSLRVP
jgi:hypothetical protein